jgi:hypothetical protein
MAFLVLVSLLNRVLLPVLGLPTNATVNTFFPVKVEAIALDRRRPGSPPLLKKDSIT